MLAFFGSLGRYFLKFGKAKIEWKKIIVDLPNEDIFFKKYLPKDPKKANITAPQYSYLSLLV